MNRIGAIVLGALIVTPVSVQAQTADAPGLRQTSNADSGTLPIETSPPRSHPLVVLGQVGVHAWAPVQPSYNADAGRNRAADPLWEADRSPGP
jgi:hypothetical protein